MRATLNKLIKTISLTIAIILAVSLIPPVITKADVIDSGTCGENLTWTLDSDGTLTISGEGEMEFGGSTENAPWYLYKDNIISVVVEEDVKTIESCAFFKYSNLKSVDIYSRLTRIGHDAFRLCSSLEHIIIPDSITIIDDWTFEKCSSLERIEIPNCVTSIGSYAFNDCSNLTDIVIPDSVTSIGSYAFCNCSSLTDLEIPDSVIDVGQGAFSTCSSLTNISIGQGVTSIGEYAFTSCSDLSQIKVHNQNRKYDSRNDCNAIIETDTNTLIKGCNNTIIPNDIEFIGVNAFSGCQSLIGIEIPDSVTSIGNDAFERCSNLTEIIIPDSVTNIGEFAFYGCSSLSRIIIGSGVTSIKFATFENCIALTRIDIPDSVKDIGQAAFSGCTALTDIEISNSVTSIGFEAFSGCRSLSDIEIPDSVISIGIAAFEGCSTLTSIKLSENLTSLGDRAFKSCINLTYIDIPDKVTDVNYRSFYDCSNLERVIIGENVTRIGEEAFYNCSNLENVSFCDNISNIGEYAFYGCSNLENIDFCNDLSSIGEYAFCQCSSLENITIPGAVAIIERCSFQECTSLEHVVIGEGTTSIGEYAFHNCNNLIYIDIPESVTNIGDFAFGGCSKLSSVEIPDGLISIGSYSFGGCSELEELVITDSVLSIGEAAFSSCGFSTVMIGIGVTSIGDNAFSYCSNLYMIVVDDLNEVFDSRNNCNAVIHSETNELIVGCKETIIPDSVTSIGSYAFSGCSDLTYIEIPDSVTNIGISSFSGCSNLADIIIPDSVTNIGNNAFRGCGLESISVDPGNVIFDSRDDSNAIIRTQSNELLFGCKNTIIPENVTSIYNYSFYNCSGLTSINIPDSVTNIGNYAFNGCSDLESITISDGITKLGTRVFGNCTALKEVYLPDNLQSIGDYTFIRCDNLNNIIIPENVKSIGRYAFRYSGVTRIDIPASVEKIDACAFSCCPDLRSVTIEGNKTAVNASAFSSDSIDSFIVPSGLSGYSFINNCNIGDIYYEGTEDEWKELDIDMGTATLFTSEDHQESLLPEITTEEVTGGIVVTIESDGSEIFYTLDGSIPCTASIPYEGTFILDEAGEYTINARAFHLDEGQCSPVCTEYVNLEQSERPEISERNGLVTIAGEGDIYYSLDVTEDPTTDSYRYTVPLSFSETTVIKARCIEEGKAESEVAGYTYYAGSPDGITFPEESYSFENTKQSFGYTGFAYRIPEERYTEIFGNAVGEFLYDEYGEDAWGGSCFGMSSTSILFHKGMLNLNDYSDAAASVYDLLAPSSSDNMLTKLIERYQISQFLPTVMEERGDVSDGGNMVISGISGNETEAEALLDAVRSGLNGGDPVILIVWRQDLAGSHAVVPYKVEDGKIYVYDCNNPGKERYITYKMNNNGTYNFSFGEYSYAVSYNRFSTLMNGLESSVDIGTAILSSDEEDRMLISIDSTDVTILVPNGNEVDLINYRATEDMETENTVVCLSAGSYRIKNNDSSKTSLSVSAVTDEDYQKVTVSDSGASIEVRERNGKVYFCIASETETDIEASALSGKGYRNNLRLSSDYAEIYSTTDRTVVIRTKTSTAVINGAGQELVNDESDTEYYFGAAVSPDAEIGARLYREGEQYTLSTDITTLPGEAFNLTVFATGGDENTMLYAANYSSTGQMIAIKGIKMTAGKTRYVFGIGKNADEVKVFMVSADKYIPLVDNVCLK